jgi:hypothetical protein
VVTFEILVEISNQPAMKMDLEGTHTIRVHYIAQARSIIATSGIKRYYLPQCLRPFANMLSIPYKHHEWQVCVLAELERWQSRKQFVFRWMSWLGLAK